MKKEKKKKDINDTASYEERKKNLHSNYYRYICVSFLKDRQFE
jgi:hypothetical protein